MTEERIIPKLKFKGQWRSYQKRVLSELEVHLDDRKLNVVAAPGAGKTILGIEVLLKLKNPVFILAPTIIIKNQWKQRIIDNFLPSGENTEAISTDIKNISEITVSTYQGLHSIYKTPEDKEKFLSDLRENGVNTLILDEAHHLRTEWWATLTALVKEMDNENFKIVSLTGTPPYDVSPAEWQNYNTLCGNVDAEISIPELVKSGDLCPHQDLVCFSDLTEGEQQIVCNFEQNRINCLNYIKDSPEFFSLIQTSDFINNPDAAEEIYKDTDFTISLISYLINQDKLNIDAGILSDFLGFGKGQIPEFDVLQAQTLVNGIIGKFSALFPDSIGLKNKLKEYRLLNLNRVDLTGETDLKKLFIKSQNKLNSILEITKLENSLLQQNLREVVLLDYIGKDAEEGLNVVSVFEKLSCLNLPCSILTGSLVTIPKSAKDELYKILESENIDKTKVTTSDYDENNLKVEANGAIDVVSILTKLFAKGQMNVLIGTAALLGEGWDSPAVNTLIIGSIAGSFMLSNQMRGRALRIDKNNPQKTSDIWHLVSLSDIDSPDLLTIQKRFRTFEGINYFEDKIQNGFERLGISLNTSLEKLNEKMFDYSKERNQLKTKWGKVFEGSVITQGKMAPMVYDVLESGRTQKAVIIENSVCNSLINKICLSRKHQKLNFAEKQFLKLCHAMKLIDDNYEEIIDENYVSYRHETLLIGVAAALLDVFCALSVIKTDRYRIKFSLNTSYDSDFYLTLWGCSNYERNLFIKSFRDIFNVNERNRYILKHKNKYYGVPECISGNKKSAEVFAQRIEYVLGYTDLIYTRTPAGRKELLLAELSKNDVKIKQSRVWI